jgi:outer membrane receptor protein involved in Fe transport
MAPEPIVQASSLVEEKITARIGNGSLKIAALQNRTFSSLSTSTGPSTVRAQQLYGVGTLCATAVPTCGTAANPGTLTTFNGGTYNVTYPTYNQSALQVSNNRDLLFEYATPLGDNVRVGASFVNSYYDIPTQSFVAISSPAVNSITATPSDVAESTNELRVFAGGNPSSKTSLDLSGYFVRVGYHVANPLGQSAVTGLSPNGWLDPSFTYSAPRLGFVWHPTSSLAVRAAAGGGFAAAPLSYLVGSSGAVPSPSVPAGSFYTLSVTNVNLQPETSAGFDVGSDLRFAPNSVLSLDLYGSNLFGQFYRSTSATGTFNGLPLYVTQYGNLGQSRYEGVLVDVRQDPPKGLFWSFSGGLTRGYVVSVPGGFYNNPGVVCTPPSPTNCKNVTVVPGVNFGGTFTTGSIPYSQALGRVGYRWGSNAYADLQGTYYGNNNTYFVPAFVEWDAHLSYAVTKNTSLLLTVRNISGVYDGNTQIYASGNLISVPTIAGLPYPEYGEMYGPRAILFTAQVRL